MSFSMSDHADKRARQRGRRRRDVDFVLEFGTPVRGGVVLTERDVHDLTATARWVIGMAAKLKGDYVAISDSTVKTAFKLTDRQASKML